MEGKHLTLLLLVLIIFLTLLLAASLALLAWLLIKLQRGNNTPTHTKLPPAKADRESRCPHHPDRPTSGKCALCEKSFCHQCLFSHEGPLFCRSHINVYLNTTWTELGEVKTTPNTPHAAEHLYQAKKDFLQKGKIPAFILTNYKINTETDTIESFVCLCVPHKNEEEASQKIKKYRENSILPTL